MAVPLRILKGDFFTHFSKIMQARKTGEKTGGADVADRAGLPLKMPDSPARIL
jgi:hypothetical protein